MAYYHQGSYHYGRLRPPTLADKESGLGTSYKRRASYASDLTYTTDVSAPVREKPLGLQGEEQYDEDDDDVHNRPLLTAGLQESSSKVIIGLKGFAGGFVSGLKRLQRRLWNKLGQILQRQPNDTVLELQGFSEGSPGYDPFEVPLPLIPRPVAIPQPTFAPHRPPQTRHASVLTKSTVTLSTPSFLSTITPSTTHPRPRHRRRDHSWSHPAVKSPQPLNVYKPSKSATPGATPSRSGVRRSYSATRSHIPSPLRDVPNREPPSSASLHPVIPSVTYLQPLSRSASSTRELKKLPPRPDLKKLPPRPDLKSKRTWSNVAGTHIYIFISLRKPDLSASQLLRFTHRPTLCPTSRPAFIGILSLLIHIPIARPSSTT
jgi:hypothetical protein